MHSVRSVSILQFGKVHTFEKDPRASATAELSGGTSTVTDRSLDEHPLRYSYRIPSRLPPGLDVEPLAGLVSYLPFFHLELKLASTQLQIHARTSGFTYQALYAKAVPELSQ